MFETVETVARTPTPFIRDPRQLLERAQRAFEQGRLKETIELLEQVLSLGTEDSAIRTMLGIACARTHQVDRALEHLERGVALAPDAFGPRCALGELYLRLAIPAQARAQLDRALACASTPAERAYIATLLRDERARDQRRIHRPSFPTPFWPRRRRKGKSEP